jgi:hypothetical protein
MMPRALLAAAVALVVTAAATGARAAPQGATGGPSDAPPAGADAGLTAYALTFGPGDHPFFRFGHNALWLHDPAADTDRVYNFGTFSFDSPRLILDFLGGRLTYWLSVAPLPGVLASYERENRSISAQRLNLTPDETRQLQRRLQDNARPENRAYKYDYFLDNCSTRVRDVVDVVVGGRLRETGHLPGRMTLRQHALRMAAEPLWLYLALDLILGPTADRPIDRWGEMFLPEELAHGLAATTVASGAPLVAGTEALFTAARPPPRASPPRRAPTFLIVGALFGLLMVSLTAGASVLGRVLFGVVLALWGLVVGFIGCFLGYAWLFTDHVVAHRNQNILLCAPWAIALAGVGIGVAAGWGGAIRSGRKLAAAALAAAIAAVVVKVGVAPRQDNVALIAFLLPAWIGITGGLARLQRGPSSAGGGVRGSGTSRP